MTHKFRFTLTSGAVVTGPVQGAGGFVSTVERIKKVAMDYFGFPCCVQVFPDFCAENNGAPYFVHLAEVVNIEMMPE